MVYLIIVTLLCVVALSFSSSHYRLMSQRVDKFQNMYYSEGGLYLGLAGFSGTTQIDAADVSSTVVVSTTSGIQSQRTYVAP
jgi:hypothetical protein